MKKYIRSAIATILVTGAVALGAATPAYAETHTCTLHNFWARPSVTCNSGWVNANSYHEVYVKIDGLIGMHGPGEAPNQYWQVIDVNNGAVVAGGQHYKYEGKVTGLYGTYKLHMAGYSGKGYIWN